MQQSRTLHEFYSSTFDTPPMLIAPFMPQGGHCLLHGKRGLGKTQLAHTLAIDVALGQRFLNTYETTRSAVFYVQADMTEQLQHERVRRTVDATGLDTSLPIYYMTFPGSFDCQQELRRGERWIDELRDVGPGLVVIDTLRKSHALDENVSNTPVEIYRCWRDIVGPHATLLYLHHDRKTSEWSAGNDRNEEFRGSGAWLDEADLGIHLCKGGSGLYIEWSKLRTCSDLEVRPINVRIDPDSLLIVADDPVEGYIKDAMRRGLPKVQIMEAATSAKRWGKQAMSRATAYRRLERYEPQS